MLAAYQLADNRIERLKLERGALTEGAAVTVPETAVWIDLLRPLAAQVAAVERLGVAVPTLEDMQEIEVSNRLYRKDGTDYLTVVLPGFSHSHQAMTGPVTFILSKTRLVTVRHHAPKPFESFPAHADETYAGCASAERLFLGLCEEIVGRLADLLESAGGVLDEAGRGVFAGGAETRPGFLQDTLESVGRQGELIGRVRLGVMTMERMLAFYNTVEREAGTKTLVKALQRDLAALSVHADFLSARVGLSVDATLGMINLAQNTTVRIVSVVAALFLPPTLVASVYGMNFALMPELERPWGYPFALGLMLLSAVGTYAFFKWRKWL